MNIHKITSDFNFDGIDLEEPKSLQGGSAYSVPIRYNQEVLLMQTQQCKCKNGFVTNGRKTYIDLVFTDNDTYILNWIESLEESLQKKIFEKSSEWFENSLTEDDIESSFLSLLKPQKNRTKYLLRCYVHNLTNFNIGVKIYDEAGNDLATKDITPDVNIACILSLQDIKFSSKNFQVFINVKQILIFRDLEKDRMLLLEPLAESKKASVPIEKPKASTAVVEEEEKPLVVEEEEKPLVVEEEEKPLVVEKEEKPLVVEKEEKPLVVEKEEEPLEVEKEKKPLEVEKEEEPLEEESKTNELSHIQFVNPTYLEENGIEELKLDDIEELKLDDIEELNLDDLEELNNLETNDTSKYIDLYNKAREKAELAKKEALDAFFEANNIRKKYNLK